MPESTMPRLGVVFAPGGAANLRDIARAARGLCRLVLILREQVAGNHPELVHAARGLAETYLWTAGTSLAGLRLDGLTTFHDQELDQVDPALVELGLLGTCDTPAAWDKLVQRGALNAAGASALPTRAVDSAADLRRAVDELGLPLVLKPRRGVGGSGVAMLSTQQDLDHVLQRRRRWAGSAAESMLGEGSHPAGGGWLAGFVSVETENVGHERRHVAVFDKCAVAVVKHAGQDGADAVRVTGDITPSRLPAQLRQTVLDKTTLALDALGVCWRVTHTELWIRGDQAQVIEVNGRVGGHLNRLLALLGGPDLVRSALELALGRAPAVHAAPPGGCAAGFFPAFLSGDAPVRSRVTRADLRDIAGVRGVDEVAEHGSLRSKTAFRVANVTVRADDELQLDTISRRAHREMGRLFAADGEISSPWRCADGPENPSATTPALDSEMAA